MCSMIATAPARMRKCSSLMSTELPCSPTRTSRSWHDDGHRLKGGEPGGQHDHDRIRDLCPGRCALAISQVRAIQRSLAAFLERIQDALALMCELRGLRL